MQYAYNTWPSEQAMIHPLIVPRDACIDEGHRITVQYACDCAWSIHGKFLAVVCHEYVREVTPDTALEEPDAAQRQYVRIFQFSDDGSTVRALMTLNVKCTRITWLDESTLLVCGLVTPTQVYATDGNYVVQQLAQAYAASHSASQALCVTAGCLPEQPDLHAQSCMLRFYADRGWEAGAGRLELRNERTCPGPLHLVRMHPSQPYAVVANFDSTMSAWRIDGAQMWSIRVNSDAPSADLVGAGMVQLTENTLCYVDPDGSRLFALRGMAAPRPVAFGALTVMQCAPELVPAESLAYLYTNSGNVFAADLRTGNQECIYRSPDGTIKQLLEHPTRRWLAVLSLDGSLDVQTTAYLVRGGRSYSSLLTRRTAQDRQADDAESATESRARPPTSADLAAVDLVRRAQVNTRMYTCEPDWEATDRAELVKTVCQICFSAAPRVCYLPCRHVATCRGCMLQYDVQKCPLRCATEAAMLVYFP